MCFWIYCWKISARKQIKLHKLHLAYMETHHHKDIEIATPLFNLLQAGHSWATTIKTNIHTHTYRLFWVHYPQFKNCIVELDIQYQIQPNMPTIALFTCYKNHGLSSKEQYVAPPGAFCQSISSRMQCFAAFVHFFSHKVLPHVYLGRSCFAKKISSFSP